MDKFQNKMPGTHLSKELGSSCQNLVKIIKIDYKINFEIKILLME